MAEDLNRSEKELDTDSSSDAEDNLASARLFDEVGQKPNLPKEDDNGLHRWLRDSLKLEKQLDKPEDIAKAIIKDGLTPQVVDSIKAKLGGPHGMVRVGEKPRDIIAEVNKELAKTDPKLKLELREHADIPPGYRIGNDVYVSLALMNGKGQVGKSAHLYKYFENF